MSTGRRSLALAALFALAACGGNTGNDSAGGGAGGVGATGGSGGSGAAAELVGKWTGYVESYTFADSTDTVTVTIANSQLEGSVAFGEAPAPPPPTDPNVGYPPGSDAGVGPQQGPFVGFAYTIFTPSFDGERLQFDVSPNELWRLWCEMQTPIADEANPGAYGCLPNWGFESGPGGCFQTNPQTQQKVQVDCGKLVLCSMGSPCKCTAEGCSAALAGAIHFDLSVAVPKADGSVSLSGVHNVHLKKQ